MTTLWPNHLQKVYYTQSCKVKDLSVLGLLTITFCDFIHMFMHLRHLLNTKLFMYSWDSRKLCSPSQAIVTLVPLSLTTWEIEMVLLSLQEIYATIKLVHEYFKLACKASRKPKSIPSSGLEQHNLSGLK